MSDAGAPKGAARVRAAAPPDGAEILGHDLRSAIATIVTASDLLLREPLEPRQRLYVSTAREAASTALQLIADLEAGAGHDLPLTPQTVELHAFVDTLEQMLRVQTAAKALAASVERRGLPDRVVADPVRLRQIVENLVSNAVRVTASGAVRLRVSAGRAGRDEVTLRFEVEDSGPGIGAGQEGAIFGPRTQGDAATRGGAGLGLWIARDLARRMGGEISVVRAPVGGALFTVTVQAGLPGPDAEPASHAAELPQATPALSILAVDDSPIQLTLLGALLEGFGLAFETAASGPEAVAALLRRPFGLVLLDVHMAGMDGLETLSRIRALEDRGGVPVVAMTARAREGEREQLIAQGFHDYLPKPLETRHLYTTIAGLLRHPDAATAEL